MKNIKVSIDDEKYPQLLKQIYDPPQELYCIGNIDLLNVPAIAIVGCRNMSKYGEKIAKIFSEGISKEGITIVSGLAKGIDKVAHENSYKTIGKTIAVLGSGLDIMYPKENEELFNKIIDNGGLIISEFPMGTKPNKENFPKRNRIISGLSKGVIVIEAKKKSGTMITVNHALDQGRDVFVVPGNIDSINSTGTNELIKEGAKMVTSYKEVLDDI